MRRVNKGWTTLEYCWRFGVRPLMWLVKFAAICLALGAISWGLSTGRTDGVIALLIAYAVWEISRAIRSINHITLNVARGEKLIVQSGASVSVPSKDLDRVIEAIGRQEADKETQEKSK